MPRKINGNEQVTVMGASGSSHAAGVVPDPGALAGVLKFLREDATWSQPPAGSVTGVNASSGYLQFSTGTIVQWMPGPSFTGAGVATASGSWPIPFPNAIFGADCSTMTGQGGSGSLGDTDIHVVQLTSKSLSGWTARHSVGGIYSQSQTISSFIVAFGY